MFGVIFCNTKAMTLHITDYHVHHLSYQSHQLYAWLEFAFKYVFEKEMKGEALIDFLDGHPYLKLEGEMDMVEIEAISLTPWKLSFNGPRVLL